MTMPSPASSLGPSYSPEQYQRAKQALSSGAIPPDKVEVVNARLAQTEDDQARGYARTAVVETVRKATRDDTLPNASGLKVYSAPPEYEPPVKTNPFSPMSPLAFAPSKNNVWFEPTVKDFRAALSAGGPLAERAKAELGKGAYGDDAPLEVPEPNAHTKPRVKDITQLGNKPADPNLYDDSVLENSEAFKAYRDAAWQHALADSVAKKSPIYRAAFTKKLSDTEKQLAGALDTGGAIVGGAGQAASLGLLDPLKRAINPELAASDRQQRNRSPKAEMAGEFAGSMVGAPEMIARGSASFLGKKLGAGPIGRLATSAGAGAITGGVGAQTRAIAQSAADALEAGDSATEMAARIYDTLSLQTAGTGAALGGGAGVAGHAIGSALGAGAKKIVTSGDGDAGRAATVKQNLDTGGKMDWKGQIKTEPEIDNLRHAAPYDMPADEILARKAAKPMLTQRRLEQEAAHREADAATTAARERLGGQTVPVDDTAIRLEAYADSLADDSAASEIRKLARKARRDSLWTPEELDKHIDLMDQKAGYDSGKKLDKKRAHFVEAGRILREDRDSLRFDEPTNAGGFALRDSRGNVKSNTDYSAVKTELSSKQHKLNEENKLLGLPDDIPVAPQRIGSAQEFALDPGEPTVASPLETMPRPSKATLAAHRENVARASSSVTPEEREAVRRFSHGYDESIRKMQRGATDANIAAGHKRGMDHASEARESIPHLESYMAKMPPATEIPYVYRGITVSPEEAQVLLKSRTISADPDGAAVTSASADPIVARSFVARNLEPGKVGVVLKLKHKTAVGTSGLTAEQMGVEKELLLHGKSKYRVVRRYEDSTNPGQYIIEAEEMIPGPPDDSARTALAEGTEPNVQLPLDQEKAFLGSLQSAGRPGRSMETKAQARLAERSGVSKEYDLIKKMRARKDYRSLLAQGMSGISAGPGGVGNKFLSSNQLLRAVPALRSLSGGLPKMEATDALVDLVDRHLAQQAGQGRASMGDRIFDEMVPEARTLNLRGGQPARLIGAARRDEKGDAAKLTPEETALAKAIIKNLLKEAQ